MQLSKLIQDILRKIFSPCDKSMEKLISVEISKYVDPRLDELECPTEVVVALTNLINKPSDREKQASVISLWLAELKIPKYVEYFRKLITDLIIWKMENIYQTDIFTQAKQINSNKIVVLKLLLILEKKCSDILNQYSYTFKVKKSYGYSNFIGYDYNYSFCKLVAKQAKNPIDAADLRIRLQAIESLLSQGRVERPYLRISKKRPVSNIEQQDMKKIIIYGHVREYNSWCYPESFKAISCSKPTRQYIYFSKRDYNSVLISRILHYISEEHFSIEHFASDGGILSERHPNYIKPAYREEFDPTLPDLFIRGMGFINFCYYFFDERNVRAHENLGIGTQGLVKRYNGKTSIYYRPLKDEAQYVNVIGAKIPCYLILKIINSKSYPENVYKLMKSPDYQAEIALANIKLALMPDQLIEHLFIHFYPRLNHRASDKQSEFRRENYFMNSLKAKRNRRKRYICESRLEIDNFDLLLERAYNEAILYIKTHKIMKEHLALRELEQRKIDLNKEYSITNNERLRLIALRAEHSTIKYFEQNFTANKYSSRNKFNWNEILSRLLTRGHFELEKKLEIKLSEKLETLEHFFALLICPDFPYYSEYHDSKKIDKPSGAQLFTSNKVNTLSIVIQKFKLAYLMVLKEEIANISDKTELIKLKHSIKTSCLLRFECSCLANRNLVFSDSSKSIKKALQILKTKPKARSETKLRMTRG